MSDNFRLEYTPVTEVNKERVRLFKIKAQELVDLILREDGIVNGYEFLTSIERLEESVMWATKGFASEDMNK